MDETLSWDMHIDHISKKVKRNIGIMKHLKNCVPSKSLIMLYRTLVEPYLDHADYLGKMWINITREAAIDAKQDR